MKKFIVPILVVGGLIAFFVLVHVYRAVLGIMVYEEQDAKVLSRVYEISSRLNEYKKQNHIIPNTLSDAKINDKVCFSLKCFQINYKVINNGNDFTLAVNVNYPFIAFAYSDWAKVKDSPYCCGGLGLVEGYKGNRTDLPRYKQDIQAFATPSAWPELSNGSLFERYILLPIW